MSGDIRPAVVDQLVERLTREPGRVPLRDGDGDPPTAAELAAAVDLHSEMEQFHTEALLRAFAMVIPYRRIHDPAGDLEPAFLRMPPDERGAYAEMMAALGMRPY